MQAFVTYVEAGGRLILTGRAGCCDAGGTERSASLPERLGILAAGPEESVFRAGVAVLRRPADRDYFRFKGAHVLTRYATDQEFFDHQIKHRSGVVLSKAMEHFGVDPEAATVSAPAVKVRLTRCGARNVVHLLNYAYPETAVDVEVRLSVDLPATVEVHSPGRPVAQVAVEREGEFSRLRIPELSLYAMVA